MIVNENNSILIKKINNNTTKIGNKIQFLVTSVSKKKSKIDDISLKSSLSSRSSSQLFVKNDIKRHSAFDFNNTSCASSISSSRSSSIKTIKTDDGDHTRVIRSRLINIEQEELIPENQLPVEEEKRNFVSLSLKSHTMKKFILNELIETERSYNQLLKLIRNKYMQPMVLASKCKNPLVKSSDIPILFNHLIELIDLSDKLLTQFQSTQRNIGYVFLSLESSLVIFLKYTMHYRSNIKLIRKACQNVVFVKIDQENLSKRETKRLGMADYLIAPIQRIPRYCLLIKDLLKYTDPLNNTDLKLALKALTNLTVSMDSNEFKKKSKRSTIIL